MNEGLGGAADVQMVFFAMNAIFPNIKIKLPEIEWNETISRNYVYRCVCLFGFFVIPPGVIHELCIEVNAHSQRSC